VTSSAVDGSAPAAEVDARVRALSERGTSLYALDERTIAALRPDVILTQALCDVCAVSEVDVRTLASRLEPSPAVVSLGASSLDGVFADVARVADALDLRDEGEELLTGLRARMRHVHDILKAARAPRPRVAVLEWTAPVYAAGHWVPEMVHRAGGVDVLARAGDHSTMRTLAEVAAADPEVLIIAPCGYDAARAAAEARRSLQQSDWTALAAGRRVWAVDANGLVSRPGPRLVEGIELFAEILHPELFAAPSPARAVVL
jgi:iron complex transport system substrate-binding protein